MKAVIVECSNGAAVALCDDGTFKKLKNRGYSIGQELILQQKVSANRMVQKLSICASLALVLLSFAGIASYSYVSPYSYVSLDINPSIEYALNRYDKVISVSGINDEGQRIVSSIESDVKNQNITTAIGVTIRQLEKDNYIVEQEYNHVIVSVCSDNDTKAKAIASRVDTFSTEEVQVCAIDTMTVSKEVKDSADSLGITPGKLALIHAVAETTADSDFDMAEWTGMTVSELETTIQQASSQPSNPVTGPAAVSVINSEYLNNVLDENAEQKKDMTASAGEADTKTGSTSTEQQTNNNTNGSNAEISATKPGTADNHENGANTSGISSSENVNAAAGQNGSTADNSTAKDDTNSTGNDSTAAGNNGSAGNAANGSASAGNDNSSTGNGSSNSTSTGTVNTAGNGNAAGNNSSSGSAAADSNANSTAGQDTSAKPSDKNGGAGSGSNQNTDDILTEDSSSKKDSYPLPGTEDMEDSVNQTEESADAEDSAENGEAQEDQDISGTQDAADTGSDGQSDQTENSGLDELPENQMESADLSDQISK